MKYWIGFLVMVACMVFPVEAALAYPAFVEKEGKPCGYCHVRPSGGGKRNYRGLYYKLHGLTFKEFDDEAEAKKAGEPVGPNPTPNPKSWTKPESTPGDTQPAQGTEEVTPAEAALFRTFQFPADTLYGVKAVHLMVNIAPGFDGFPVKFADGKTGKLDEKTVKDLITLALSKAKNPISVSNNSDPEIPVLSCEINGLMSPTDKGPVGHLRFELVRFAYSPAFDAKTVSVGTLHTYYRSAADFVFSSSDTVKVGDLVYSGTKVFAKAVSNAKPHPTPNPK